jgi:hypothetical protein
MKNFNKIEKIHPRCVLGGRDPAFTISGYFVPCCWTDNFYAYNDLEMYGFFHEDFFIDNLKTPEDIKEIFKSDEWEHFYDVLMNNPEIAPNVCKQHCGIRDDGVVPATSKYIPNNKRNDIGLDKIRILDVLYEEDSKSDDS